MSRNWLAALTSRVLMLIMAGLMYLSYACTIVNPAKAWFLEIFGLLFLPLATVNAFLLVWAIIRRSKAFVIPFIALLPALFCVGRFVQFEGEQPETTENSIKMVSYNVGRFVPDKKHGIGSRKACMDSVFKFLNKEDADIICLQEFYLGSGQEVKSFLKKKFKNYHIEYYAYIGKHGSCGNVTLSRYPVKSKGKVKFDNSTNLALYTDHIIEGKKLRIYNCHFESYNISIPGIVTALGHDRNIIKETGEKMRGSILRRPKQVDKVLRDIENCPTESIVCGDFNDNPMSYTYRRLSRGRYDAFRQAGNGFGATYSVLWPFLRIDYVLVPKTLDVQTYQTPKSHYSDHYPVITEFAI